MQVCKTLSSPGKDARWLVDGDVTWPVASTWNFNLEIDQSAGSILQKAAISMNEKYYEVKKVYLCAVVIFEWICVIRFHIQPSSLSPPPAGSTAQHWPWPAEDMQAMALTLWCMRLCLVWIIGLCHIPGFGQSDCETQSITRSYY
jgi:hypothetical protein